MTNAEKTFIRNLASQPGITIKAVAPNVKKASRFVGNSYIIRYKHTTFRMEWFETHPVTYEFHSGKTLEIRDVSGDIIYAQRFKTQPSYTKAYARIQRSHRPRKSSKTADISSNPVGQIIVCRPNISKFK